MKFSSGLYRTTLVPELHKWQQKLIIAELEMAYSR
jgi:hypothetical protein